MLRKNKNKITYIQPKDYSFKEIFSKKFSINIENIHLLAYEYKQNFWKVIINKIKIDKYHKKKNF